MLGTVLIVGATASIAEAVTAAFAGHARHVIATYRSTPPAPSTPSLEHIACDIRSQPGRAQLIRSLEQSAQKIDTVVLLAGVILGKNLSATDDMAMAEVAAVNILGPMGLLRELIPHLATGARVLLVSSIAGERGSFDPTYAATKGALIPFAKSLASWHGKQFTVTVVCPGAIDGSRMLADMTPERIAHHRNASPTGELLSTDDLAHILLDLARPHWRHANGAVIRVNGGTYV